MTRSEEIQVKLQRVHGLLEKEKLEGVLLTHRGNFAWITAGGDNHVPSAEEAGIAAILVTQKSQYVLTDNIELPRLEAEEIAGLGFVPKIMDWYAGGLDGVIAKETAGKRIGTDISREGLAPLKDKVAALRWSLTEGEIERYRNLGRDCALAMNDTCRALRPGLAEHEVAGDIGGRLLAMGIEPHVLLIAADDRIKRFRHPIPTKNRIDKYCMVVICGERHGLILSMTRLVHFGPVSDDLKKRHRAAAAIDAATIAATKPGKTAGDLFAVIKQAYADNGYPDEWKNHHQGGAMGYIARDWKAHRADDPTPIVENQCFGWNPSITGTKSEDSVIAFASGPEILSPIADWPALEFETEAGAISRADILEL